MINEPALNKTEWGPGPWQAEPDRQEWNYKGLPCLMVRVDTTGSWCGYVAVSPGHPAFEKPYDDLNVEVHCGLTYADHCQGHVCHVPAPGEPDNVWWFGFDCAHAFDYSPALVARLDSLVGPQFNPRREIGERYWTLGEVKKEVESLADQLISLRQI